MRTEGNEGNEGIAPLRLLGLLLLQKSAHGGQNWAGTNPQESERQTAPEEAFWAGLRVVKMKKLWFDTSDESFGCKRPQVEH